MCQAKMNRTEERNRQIIKGRTTRQKISKKMQDLKNTASQIDLTDNQDTSSNKNRIYILFKNLIDGYNIRLPITEERMNELKKVKGRRKEGKKKKTFEDTKESSKIQSTWWNGLRDTDVQNSLLDSVGEGEGGMIWENGIETCIISYMKRIASPGSMHHTGCLGLVH